MLLILLKILIGFPTDVKRNMNLLLGLCSSSPPDAALGPWQPCLCSVSWPYPAPFWQSFSFMGSTACMIHSLFPLHLDLISISPWSQLESHSFKRAVSDFPEIWCVLGLTHLSPLRTVSSTRVTKKVFNSLSLAPSTGSKKRRVLTWCSLNK